MNSGLMTCSFYLKKRFSRKDDLLNLNKEYTYTKENLMSEESIESTYENIFDMLKDFFTTYDEFSDEENLKKIFSIEKGSIKYHGSTSDRYKAVSCTIQSGSYGIESEITNRRTKEVSYIKSEDEADVKRFKCLFFVPVDIGEIHIQKGILIFQTIGTFGVKSITVKMLKKFFSDIGLTFETRSISVGAFIEKLIEKGNLYKLTYIKNNISPDKTDNIFYNAGREERTFVKPQMTKNWLQKLLSVIKDKYSDISKSILEIDDKEYDDISITFQMGNRTRTARLSEIDKFSIVEDVPEKISAGQNGLIGYMIETATDYMNNMVFHN